jgi:hypothetical protein
VKTPRKVDGLKGWASKLRPIEAAKTDTKSQVKANAAAAVAATAVPKKGLLSDTAKLEGDR